MQTSQVNLGQLAFTYEIEEQSRSTLYQISVKLQMKVLSICCELLLTTLG